MDKTQLMLAAMATAESEEFTPVQVQKLLFLIDRNIGNELGGTGFVFAPYDYGPFDATIYEVLRALEFGGLACSAATSKGWKKYSLTVAGVEVGKQHLSQLPPRARDYIERVSEFVRRTSFTTLLSSIYKAYPEMKVNSVFRD